MQTVHRLNINISFFSPSLLNMSAWEPQTLENQTLTQLAEVPSNIFYVTATLWGQRDSRSTDEIERL